MRVAVSGSSSTGKTSLIDALERTGALAHFHLSRINTDERQLLESMGTRDTGSMPAEQLRAFQKEFLRRKVLNESGRDDFISEHSFIDIAAYWLQRDVASLGPVYVDDQMLDVCRAHVSCYDVHLYLPFGKIPFVPDGYRSLDMTLHRNIATKIEMLLDQWGAKYWIVGAAGLEDRLNEVTKVLNEIAEQGNNFACARRV